MPALETVGQYITESRRLLQDQIVPYRYPDTDIVDALNVGLLEARRLRADLFLPLFDLPWFDTAVTINTSLPVPMHPQYGTAFVYSFVGRTHVRDVQTTTHHRA